jgi:hypothetical protein
MQTLAGAEPNVKAFYATVYDMPARLVQVDGVIYVVTDDDVEPFEVEMAPFTCVLGEIGLADCQQLMDRLHGGYASVCTSRQMAVQSMSTSIGSTNGASDYEADLDLLYAWMPPSTPAAPCPEATFSITLRGTLDGVETLLTARGQTAEEFKRNLQAIRGLLDQPQPTPQAASQAEAPIKDWCGVHQVRMYLNHGKDGRTWWSHRTPEGTFCKGRQ